MCGEVVGIVTSTLYTQMWTTGRRLYIVICSSSLFDLVIPSLSPLFICCTLSPSTSLLPLPSHLPPHLPPTHTHSPPPTHPSLSVKFLLESVKTFTEEDTASGLDQARQLVVEVLMDSQFFVFDHILRLPAVRALSGEPSHKVGRRWGLSLRVYVQCKLPGVKQTQDNLINQTNPGQPH